MSDALEVIFFYPHPHTPYDVLVTTNSQTRYFDHLWNLAQKAQPRLKKCLDGEWPIFFIPEDLPIDPPTTLLSRSRTWLREHRDNGQKVITIESLHGIFPSAPSPHLVHVLVVTEELLEGLDDLGDLGNRALKQRADGIKSFHTLIPSPSAGVSKPEDVMKVVHHSKNNFHSGRPVENFGPPVSLFNHALGRFDYHLYHLDDEFFPIDPPPTLIELTHVFMTTAASGYADESTRTAAVKSTLDPIIGRSLNWAVSRIQYGIRPDAINFGDIPFFVVEVKNEAGLEGDASLQAALSYAHIATSFAGPVSWKLLDYPIIRSNYPAVLYGIMGNLLEIGVAMYTDGVYYNLLFSERLCLDFYAAKNLLRLSRAFAATRQVINDLTEFYMSPLPAPESIAHLFPSPLQVPTSTDFVPPLTFTSRLSRSGETAVLADNEIARQSGMYLATMTHSADEDTVMSSSADVLPDTEVVVKFTAQYNPEAHRLLASRGFAPLLHACVSVCSGLFMVVMDHVHGETAWLAGARGELLPYDIYKDIQDAVALLHSEDFVFGDLRLPNIMIVPGRSSSDARRRGMLIDFDWVGTHRIGRYPASLNNGLQDWVGSGVERYGIMDKAHDLVMLSKFMGQCHSA